MTIRILTAIACVAMTATAAHAGTPEQAIAAPNRLEANRARDDQRQPLPILRFANLSAGDTVVDIMAGDGYFSELAAHIVGPRGQVIAINPTAFHPAESWAHHARHWPNLSPLVTSPAAMVLAPRSVDHIFTHLVYHDLYWESAQYQFPRLDVPAVLANWRAALRPGGTVIVVDHVGPAGDPRAVTERLHRIDPARVRADFEAAGFILDASSDVLLNTTDAVETNVFDPAVRGRTSRFAMRFRVPG